MMNTAVERTVLLLLPSRKALYPLSTAALGQAQASQGDLQKMYGWALLLDADGVVRRILGIKVLGPMGNSWPRRLLSRLTNGWRIETQLSVPEHWEFLALKALVIECAEGSRAALDDWAAGKTEEIIAALGKALTPQQVFAALALPAPEDALDVL